MKTLARGLTIVLLLIGAVTVQAQNIPQLGDPKWGKDTTERQNNLRESSLYRQFYKQKNFADAFPHWLHVYNAAPKASKNFYIHGANILEWKIKNAEDETAKQAWIDSLMVLFDKRIENFGSKAYVLTLKGVNLAQFRPEARQDIYDILKESIEIGKTKSSHVALVNFMMASNALFSNGEIEGGKVVEDYAKSLEIIEKQIEAKPDDENLLKAKDAIDNIFKASGTATAESVEGLFAPRFEATPEDPALLTKIIELFDLTEGGDESVLFAKASENLHKIQPSATSAYGLAKLFRNKGEFQKSSEYFLNAVELNENAEDKAKYYIELSDLTFRDLGNNQLAASYARKALENNPESGHAYILLGSIYGNTKCSENELEEAAVYWFAVDMFAMAKQKDPELTAQADKFIEAYAARFPQTKTVFFYDYQVGGTFSFENCWIPGSTKVRVRD